MRRLMLVSSLVLVACASNPYGYAPEYAPLSDEEGYLEQASGASYEDVRRNPASHEDELLGWFGVVEKVDSVGAGGEARVSLNLHFHQPRHLCTDQFDSSCRVTISEKQGGPFSAILMLRPEDASGRDRLYTGSLVRVYGHPVADYDERGGPILKAEYYRHWPRGTYVTTGRRVNMRR